MFAIEGFATIAQNFISRGIASNFYAKAPWLSMLGALSLGNQRKGPLEIGRPGSGEILSGAAIDPVEKRQLSGRNFYIPRIQKFTTNNTKKMGLRDTYPVVNNATTTSHGQANQAGAKFGWTDIITPILIWHEDKIRAEGAGGGEEGQAIEMAQLINEATEVAYQEHVDALNDMIWNGNPTDQSLDLWDDCCGILQAAQSTNTYGNVNRSVETSWAAQYDTTFTKVNLQEIVDDANLTKRLGIIGDGIDLLTTTPALYSQFKAQLNARAGVQIYPSGPPEMLQIGVKREMLKVDNVWVIYDDKVPASNVIATTSKVWKFQVHPRRNLTVTKFVDLSETGEGGKDADQAFIRSRFIFSNDNPALLARYTAIGT